MLEDLVAAAINDTRAPRRTRHRTAEMGKMTAGMQLPPGFKLPNF